MGNIGSQTGHISQRSPPEEQWAHSFPRTQPLRHSHQLKVLPERDARQKLRQTNNGEILHSGGTISGRQNKLTLEINDHPTRNYKEHSPPVRTYFSNERDPLHKSRSQGVSHKQNAASQKALQEQNDKMEWEENSSDTDFPARKPRLFKTRAETKKNSSHVNKISNVEYTESSNINIREDTHPNIRSKRLSLPEIKLANTDEFQRELKEATKRLRHIQMENKSIAKYEPVSNNTSSNNSKNPKEKLKTLDHNINRSENARKTIKDIVEIPRFSPAAAWRLLSTAESIENVAVTTNDDGPVFIEERIEKFSRPPPPIIQIGQRSTHDKSGDSGISGDDAMPTNCFDDTTDNRIIIPAPTTSYINTQERVSWTPQQDLGDDSSIDECVNNIKSELQKSKVHSGPHLFSLSLPRDNQLASYMIEKANRQYTGLQKLKRSVSGVLNNLSNKREFVQANLADEESVNWFLSRSAPNSLSNGFHSLEIHKSQDSEQMYPNKTSRVMYLPEAKLRVNSNPNATKMIDDRENSQTGLKNIYKLSVYSKSCEDLTTQIKNEPEALQDLPVIEDFPWNVTRKPKKFTFQSTIRQIEKKRLSDKLSREAERREKKRLRELEAMQKVEEEFQRKRAKEKASIRQQLRLYCMDEDATWSSLPPNLEIKNEIRPEPDGAISSSTTSSSPLPPIKSTNSTSFFKYDGPDEKNCDGTKGGGGNYRKDFAYGVKSTMSATSTYSEDSQNNSQAYHSKYAPITRY
ncbi:hypothetical protein NQ317_010450 [Molorchus minor]|uniref:Uncharacterized protein n=1 Tax=Molorchus minor TaxID=1323400 RepID=A0ABQ9JXZ1_9CUCU|nr:hypothetical protein NQ317_010450 [Molorchus minor]